MGHEVVEALVPAQLRCRNDAPAGSQRIRLDDAALAHRLPTGTTGTTAIFTYRVRAAHIIRKVLLRQIAITNYINPF